MLGDFSEKNISKDILKEFIKFRINDSLKQIGYSEVFDVDNKLISNTDWFYEELLGNNMTDFFKSRPVEYSKSNKAYDELF